MISQPRLNTFQPVNQPAGSNPQPGRVAGIGGQLYDPRPQVGPSTPARMAVESERRLEAQQANMAPRQSISSHTPTYQYVPLQNQPQYQATQPQPRPAPNGTSSRTNGVGSKTSIKIFEDDAGAFHRPISIGSQTPNSNLLRRSENLVSTTDLTARNALPPRQVHAAPQKPAYTPITPPKSPLPEKVLTPVSRNPPNNFDFRVNDHSPYQVDSSNGRYLTPNPAPQASLTDDSTAQIAKLENELAQLRLQKKNKEAELAELAGLRSAQGRGGQKDILSECVKLAMDVKNKESDLKDLRLNYNLLKEETEKQKRDLAQFEEGDELERAPRSRADLLAQNAKLRDRLEGMTREFEKRVYDKTLEIERKARAKMHKIAMGIALKHLPSDQPSKKDPEIDQLISEIQRLEKENEMLEQKYHAAELSMINEASEIH